MFKRTIVLMIVFGIGAAMLLPFAGGNSGMSPIPAVWAAPNCDADGDLYLKNNRKCGGDDPDDSDPCVPDSSAEACSSGGGGGGTGGDLGSAISMDCILVGTWGDGSGETIKGDRLLSDQDIDGTKYSDAVDKVDCSIDGPSTPWPIRLGLGVKGRPENSVRKVDVNLGPFVLPVGFKDIPGVNPDRVGDTQDLSDDYPSLFEPATEGNAGFPNMDDMEPIRIGVRPYRDDPNQTADGIHLLPPGTSYEMGLRINFPGTEHFNFSVASQWYEGNESFTGIGCETGFEQQILENAPDGHMQDVSVYLWLDGNDADDLPDGYTVSTGVITKPAGEGPPLVSAGTRYAAVCSSVGPAVCGNPQAPSNCNFLGYVPVTFTMHARVK